MNLDFTDPLNSSQSYVDLLNSNQEISSPETLPQETHSPFNRDGNGSRVGKQSRATTTRWKAVEEKVLTQCWLNTSKDSVKGHEQTSKDFWGRVAALFSASPLLVGLAPREANTCKQKWRKMSQSVSKFAGCYDYACRNKKSGQNENDFMQVAHELYISDHPKKLKFSLEHIWRMVRHDQKWCKYVEEKQIPPGASSTSTNACPVEEEAEERPLGVKASKPKGKKRVRGQSEDAGESSLKVLQEMWEIKKEDLAGQEKILAGQEKLVAEQKILSQQKILDSLLLKPEPLSEAEIILKNKLITEMCNNLGIDSDIVYSFFIDYDIV